jgi:hypothetical protein
LIPIIVIFIIIVITIIIIIIVITIIIITTTTTTIITSAFAAGKLILTLLHNRCAIGGGPDESQPLDSFAAKLELHDDVFQAILNLATAYMGARLCAECVSLPLLLALPVVFACTPRHLARILPMWSRDRSAAAAIMCQWGLHCRDWKGEGETISSVADKCLSESVGLDALFRAKNAFNCVTSFPDGSYKLRMDVPIDRLVFGALCDAADAALAKGQQREMWRLRHRLVMASGAAGQPPFDGDVSQNGDGFLCFR